MKKNRNKIDGIINDYFNYINEIDINKYER